MKPVISWLTGNPLPAAGRISAARGDTNLVPIASRFAAAGRVVPSADQAGFVGPGYDAGIPFFAGKLHQRGDP